MQRNFYNGEDYQKFSFPQTQRGLSLTSLAKPKDNEELLDVGCGDGRNTWHLFYQNTNIKSIVGIDISEEQIKLAKELSKPNLPKNDEWKKKTSFICGDFLDEKLLKDKNFDLIFSNTAVHWIGPEAYKRMFNLLKENGRICVEQCAKDDLEELHEVCREVIKEMGLFLKFKDWKLENHGYWLPTKEEMIKVLEDANFKDIKVEMYQLTYPKDFTEIGIYEAFLVSSLHRYFDVIKDENLCNEFKARVRLKFYENTPPAHANRLRLTAFKEKYCEN